MIQKNQLKILFVEDLPADVELAVMELRKENLRFDYLTVCTRVDLINALNEFKPDLVISDYSMPEFNGLQALKVIKELNSEIPFILFTGSVDEETAVECIKAGAQNYVLKGHLARLPFAVKEALEQVLVKKEMKATDLLLKDSEERLQSIFSAAPVGIGLIVKGIILEVNDAFCEMTGFHRNELIGSDGKIIFPTIEEFEFKERESTRQIAEKFSATLETMFKCKNGNVLDILLSLAPLDKNDLSKGFTFTALDITKRKQAEIVLTQTEERFRNLYNDAVIGLYRTNTKGEILLANRTLIKMLGFQSFEELTERNLNESGYSPSYQRKSFIDQIEREGEVKDKEAIWISRDGREIFIRENAKAIYDPEGKILYYDGTVQDVTEQKKVAEALNKINNLFKTLAKASPVGIFRTDANGYTTYVNPKWSELSGVSSEEANGYGWLDAVHPEDRGNLSLTWLKDLKARTESNIEYRFLRPDGSIIWVMGKAVPEVKGNEVIGYIGTITEITERKQAEETIKILARFPSENPDPVLRIHRNGILLYANEASYKQLDWKFEVGEKTPLFLQEIISEVMKGGVRKIIETENNQKIFSFDIVPIVGEDYVNLYGKDITERKKADKELRESESSLLNSQEIAKMGSWEWDLVTQKNKWSDNYFAIQGLKPGEIEPNFDFFRNRIHPDDVHFLDETHVNIMDDKTSYSFELRLIQPDGTFKWIQNYISPVIENDKLVKLKGVIIDINERKQAEDILRSSEERLKILFDYAPDAYYLYNLKGNLVDGNIACEKLLGYSKDELVGKNFLKLNLLSVKQLPRAAKLLVMNSLGKSTGPVEFILNRKDGSKVTVEIISHPVKIKGQTLALSMARDISERKRTEKVIREGEEKYRMIFENVQDVYYETSVEGLIHEVSPSIKVLSRGQYQRDDLIGKSMYDFYPDPIERTAFISKITENGTVSDFEITLKNKDGSHVPCSISAKIILDPVGHPERIIGSAHDITDRKNASDALRLGKEKAEAGDRLKTAFLNNISHEVRTPLNGILGFAEIITMPDLSEADKNDSISMLHESSDRLMNTITDYMDISLITSGSISVNNKSFIPGYLLGKIYENSKPKCSKKKLELLLQIPSESETLSIYSDPEIFHKIISQFLSNAIKFTEKGTINLGFIKHEKDLEFFVKDTGIGIRKESLGVVFDNFTKEDTGQLRLAEGSGLGLSIARGMVEVLGGTIKIESEIGAGSCFSFSIPFIKDTKKTLSGISDGEPKKIERSALILVAEDDETNFLYLSSLLNRETEATILHAWNGREAIELFKANPDIVLILMDIKMPEIDGLEATTQIKLINKHIPVIGITAYAMSGDEERVLASGCDGYLSKPLNKKNLMNKIAEVVKM